MVNVYMNLSASYIDNQLIMEIMGSWMYRLGTYNVYQQHTFNLGKNGKLNYPAGMVVRVYGVEYFI
ncbi:MAG: hypothetical protein IPJ13_32195 [Saprospiraceae bacterium]|nr:hypothetical protein [Saprospiraceae bacterium]